MTALPSLPTLDVYVAFNPTALSQTLTSANTEALPASGASNSYWTNVSQYVRDFTTRSGRQHFLDRVESGTLSMTLNNRDGYFNNGTLNGTTYILDIRTPIAVTATVSATTYPIFWGLTDSIDERIGDQVNSDLTVQASDYLKMLSLRYMDIPSFWKNYAASASTVNWYRATVPSTAIVTAATGSGTTITYTALNTFSVGDNVTITGLNVPALNLSDVAVATASATQFTVSSTHTGTSSGTGTAYRAIIVDAMGSANGDYLGVCSFPQYGAIIYDSNGCCDVANGGSTVSGQIRLPVYSSTMGGVDFWVLGQGLGNGALFSVTTGANTAIFVVTTAGYAAANISGTVTASSVKIDDGYWHHVGFVSNSAGTLELYVDGTYTTVTGMGTGWTAPSNLVIGFLGNLATPAYYDEIVVSSNANLATLQTEVSNRYRAGTLLQLPTNTTQAAVKSGDRIAEILCLAGFGSIVNGAVSLHSNVYYINNSGTAWVSGTSTNGYANVEPFYWDTPPLTSTALDLIIQICDTDIGAFLQKPDGTLNFYNQNFYGSWAWNSTTKTGTWTPATYTIPADHVWTDDGTSSYAYFGPSLRTTRDDADVWTSVRIQPQAGVAQIYENTTAEARWGYTTLTKSSTLPTSLDSAYSAASYLGYLFRSPLPRVSGVELQSENANGANLSALLGSKLMDVVTFKRTPPNAAGSGIINQTMMIESVSHDFSSEGGYWHTTFTLDPYPVRT